MWLGDRQSPNGPVQKSLKKKGVYLHNLLAFIHFETEEYKTIILGGKYKKHHIYIQCLIH